MPKLSKAEAALRERILQGASLAFGELGFAAARVEDIIAHTGISRPTFYKVFDSKDAAFKELSARHHRSIRDRLTQAVASSVDPALQLERSIEAFLRWRAELGPLGHVLDTEARTPGSKLTAHRARTLDFVTELSQAGLATQGRAPVDPVLLRALVAAAESVADQLLSKSPVTEQLLQRAKAIVMRIDTATLAGPTDAVAELPVSQGKSARSRKPRK